MPVVPTEQNKIDLASVSGAKFEAADLSGTGLQALGAGMQSLGETGQKVADDQHKVGVEQHQAAIADDAAVKAAWNAYSDQARAIRANFYAQQGAAADAALQPSIEALHGTKAALHAGLTSHRQRDMFDRAVQGPLGYDVIGFNAYAARAKGVEQDNQSVIAQDGLALDAAHNADNPAFASKLLETGSESIRTQAIVQGRDPASVDEKVAKYRSFVHLDVILGPKGHDPLAAHHYLAKNSGDMIEPHKLEAARLLAPALGQLRGVADIDSYPMLRSATEPATPPGDIATVTGRILDVEAARRTGGDAGGAQVTSAPGVADASTTGMLALMQLYRGSAPKSLAASLLGTDAVDALVAKHGKDWFAALPGETYKAVVHDMGMLGAGTSPREAPAPEDRAAVAGWIDAQPWDDARKQSAHEELHTRAGLEDRRRTEARDKAKEAAFATIDTLGAGFISVNQLPPAVRRDLGDDALAALTLRANRNVHPVTVAAHGDVAMDLNRMAASNPDAFVKQDLRLHRDEMTPAEYDALGRLQKGIGTYPPAPAAMTQRRALETMQRNGLDVGPRDAEVTNQPAAIEGAAPPDPAPEQSPQTDEEVDRLANVDTIPEALRGADTTKAAIREMLRNDWTPDQIQTQLYEAYVRRALGQGGGPIDQSGDAERDQSGTVAEDWPDEEGNAAGAEQTAQLMPIAYGKPKSRRAQAKQTPAPHKAPAWVKKQQESIWRSPIYLSSSRDEDAYKAVRRMGNPDGWTIIYTHGDTTRDGKVFDRFRGEPDLEMPALKIFNDLTTHPGYDPNAIVLLTACYGANDTTARDLSAMTRGVVYVAKGYVSEPSVEKNIYRLTVNNQYGKKTGFAKFVNGVEVPSTLLSLSYDRATHSWKFGVLTTPAPVGDRSPSPGKEPWYWRLFHPH